MAIDWKRVWEKITEFGFKETGNFLKSDSKKVFENWETLSEIGNLPTAGFAWFVKRWKTLTKIGMCATVLTFGALKSEQKRATAPERGVYYSFKKAGYNVRNWLFEKLGLKEEYRRVCVYLAFMRVLQRCKFKWAREIDRAEVTASASNVLVRKPTPGVPRIRDRDRDATFMIHIKAKAGKPVAEMWKNGRLAASMSA
ncbi:MAG: hypothetical protein IJX36_05365 [Thermoguttaceae bacterium]|nr:hypothetical protein [Thermoguttaceae bacterium]MBQ8363337.1 hypothetical protein [Thermoguttaceae bacterium]